MSIMIKNSVCFALLICMFLSCKKEAYKTRYDELLPQNNGVVSGLLNGQEWRSNICRASYFKSNNTSDTINITASIFINGYERQNLNIGKISLLSATQKIESTIRYDSVRQKYYTVDVNGCYSVFFPVDVDVPENVYWLYEDETTNNHVKIEEYNTATKEIRGSFEGHYTRVQKDRPLTQGLPDTLHFTNGKFEFQLK